MDHPPHRHLHHLPVEMKEKVLAYLGSAYLYKVASLVCREWAEIAGKILQSRRERLGSKITGEVRAEINSTLCPSARADEIEILIAYEQFNLTERFTLKAYHDDFKSGYLREGMDSFFSKVIKDRGCDCTEIDACLARSIYFMPCYQLILVQIPERIAFYSMKDVLLDADGGKELESVEYATSVHGTTLNNVWIDNNTHTAVSVYMEYIVSQETTRALVLFKVREVDHAGKRVVLENVRRIFLPNWSCALMMLENKVCALFTTGAVAVWKKDEDDLSISVNRCGSPAVFRAMRTSGMYRLGSLILIKVVSDMDPEVSWSVVDTDFEGEFRVSPFNFNTLVDAICLDYFSDEVLLLEVRDVFLSFNTLVLHCYVSRSDDGTVFKDSELYVKRLIRPLTIQDFADPISFRSAFYNPAQTKNDDVHLYKMQNLGSILPPALFYCDERLLSANDVAVPCSNKVVFSIIVLKMSKRKAPQKKRIRSTRYDIASMRIDVVNT